MDLINKNSDSKQFIHLSYILIFLSTYGCLIHLHSGNINNAIINASIAIIFLFILKSKTTHHFKVYTLLSIGILFFIPLLYTGGLHHTGWLWTLTFSPIATILLNKKQTVLWVLAFGSILLSIYLAQLIFNISTAYSNYELLTLIIIYTFNSYLHLFKNKIDYYNSELTKINLELKNKISEEIQANENKNKLLHIQSKQAQMGEMVSMIAHQWRQPLNAISASAIKLKLENDLDVITPKSINKISMFIQDRTQDMSEIINNFLDYSKSTTKSSNFKITKLVDKTFKVIKSEFALRGIFVTINYADEIKDKIIFGVENLLEQVILNLLFNVRDAFDEQKTIDIKNIYISIDKSSSIIIEDNAGGIPTDILDKVFNPYFTTKEEGRGTGLGLYMSRKIMRDNFDGDLIYTPIKNGSSFTITFNTQIELPEC